MTLKRLNPYTYQDTFFHKLNLKIKVIGFLILLVFSSLIKDIFFSSTLFIISILFLFLSKISFSRINTIKTQLIMIFIMAISILIFSYNNNENIYNSFYNIYCLLARTVSSLLLIICFFGTTKLEKLISFLVSINMPNIIIQIFLFSSHFVFIYYNELKKLIQILNIKGFKLRLNIQNLYILSNIVGILFSKSYDKSNVVYYSMLSKGYSGRITIKYKEKIKKNDIIFLISILFYICIYILYTFMM